MTEFFCCSLWACFKGACESISVKWMSESFLMYACQSISVVSVRMFDLLHDSRKSRHGALPVCVRANHNGPLCRKSHWCDQHGAIDQAAQMQQRFPALFNLKNRLILLTLAIAFASQDQVRLRITIGTYKRENNIIWRCPATPWKCLSIHHLPCWRVDYLGKNNQSHPSKRLQVVMETHSKDCSCHDPKRNNNNNKNRMQVFVMSQKQKHLRGAQNDTH